MTRIVRLRALAIFVVTLVCGFSLASRPADATWELKLNYWPTTVTNSKSSGQFGNWSTNFWGGDLRWTSDTSHWGIHLKYDTATPGSWGGTYAGSTGGTDTVWSGDLFYAWQLTTVTLRGFAGWGDIKHVSNFGLAQTLEARGYRVGADVMIPVPNTRWAFNATAAWYPSTSTSFTFGSTTTSGGNATDFGASVQYMWPRGWLVEGGYRWITENTGALPNTVCPCTVRTSGPFFDVGYHM
ncbi:MAG TPA: hypothetical protein VGX75_09360 [bacterium]|nr:hypothetical protein [bacterium]